jgi:phospholipid-translocating ATPase
MDYNFLQQVQSQNIHVGDIVRVKRDESFPCDLVLISTSNNEGKCYITTANLDGETNLKVNWKDCDWVQTRFINFLF